MSKLRIRDFKGVFTHADAEDIDPEYLTSLVNLRPVNGSVRKTFGMGKKMSGPNLPSPIMNLTAFVDSHFDDGYILVATFVSRTTNEMTLYYWTGTSWVTLSSAYTITGETIYHKFDKNPVILNSGIMRVLPGLWGGSDGSPEVTGMWFGYIDRTIFDGEYAIPQTFYGYRDRIVAPNAQWTVEEIDYQDSGFIADDTYYYRFSYIYDGAQESLLSENITKWVCSAAHKAVVLSQAVLDRDSLSKRITAIKVYRAHFDTATGITGLYNFIQTIDFLRPSDDVLNGTDGLYHYANSAAVPGLSTYTFDSAKAYTLQMNGTGNWEAIDNPQAATTGSGHYYFEYTAYTPTALLWNVPWSLKEDGGEVASNEDDGAYHSDGGIAVVNEIPEDDIYANGILRGNLYGASGEIVVGLTKNDGQVLGLKNTIAEQVDQSWDLFKPDTSMFQVRLTEDSGDNFYAIRLYDTNLPVGEEHPLADSGGINVIGKFATVIGGVLWQANIVLDPGGKNEVHTDWAAKSEPGQYDVNPVGNVVYCEDDHGGDITGLAELYKRPVVMKPQAILVIDPSTMAVTESAHNIGNIADQGSISIAGALFVCWHDGIYRLTPNNLAETDMTPTERLKITGSIEDQYLALTTAQKEGFKVTYDARRSEIMWMTKVPAKTNGTWAWVYNIQTKEWREITTDSWVTGSDQAYSFFSQDEEANPLFHDATTKYIKSLSTEYSESVTSKIATKTFVLSDVRPEVFRSIALTYKSEAALTINVYLDNSTSIGWTGTLPASSIIVTKRVYPRMPAMKASVEVIGAQGTTDMDTDEIIIEMD